ncbi:hypothetical protein [Paraburkholderia sp. C35]|uniref:hypothetical protein n=1 Tax=Paraburkholderia sp. C35 TaxID=2126993 RepID=UPI000D692A3D|nr:hypothetical protein [Paraburkholderia sp. C35]
MSNVDRTDGDAGARRATALLGVAVCAEARAASLNEDYKKVDLRVSFVDAFAPERLLQVHCQVKAGPSFVSTRAKGRRTMRLNDETKHALAVASPPALLAWVPPAPSSRVYWYVPEPRVPVKKTIYIPDHQYITPYLRYHLSRVAAHGQYRKGLPMLSVKSLAIERVQQAAKAAYKELQTTKFRNPITGEVAITRLAWRHVTRKSKRSTPRVSALRVVPYLKAFIGEDPDRYQAQEPQIEKLGSQTIERRNILLWYRDALNIDGVRHTLILRIREEVTYPSNWHKYLLSARDIAQKATLASWWVRQTVIR